MPAAQERKVWSKWEIGAGDSIRRKIAAGLGTCTVFIVLPTPNSVSRPWVGAEGGIVRQPQHDSAVRLGTIEIDKRRRHDPELSRADGHVQESRAAGFVEPTAQIAEGAPLMIVQLVSRRSLPRFLFVAEILRFERNGKPAEQKLEMARDPVELSSFQGACGVTPSWPSTLQRSSLSSGSSAARTMSRTSFVLSASAAPV